MSINSNRILLAAAGGAGGVSAEGFFSILSGTHLSKDFGFDSSDNIYTSANNQDPGALVLSSGGVSVTAIKEVSTSTLGNTFATSIDSSQNIYTSGRTSSANYNGRAEKFNSSASLQWAKEYSESNTNLFTFISSETDGSYVYTTGNARHSDTGQFDRVPLVKIDVSTGNVNAACLTDSTSTFYFNIGERMTLDNSGNILIAAKNLPVTGSGQYSTIFKFNTSLSRLWATTLHVGTIGSGGRLEPRAITCDTNGNVYVVGNTNQDIGSGERSYVSLSKLNSSGVLQFSYFYYLPSNNSTTMDNAKISVDTDGSIFVTASATISNYFTPTGSSQIRTLFWKFDSSGNVDFCHCFGHQTGTGSYTQATAKSRINEGLVYNNIEVVASTNHSGVLALPTDGSGLGSYSSTSFGDYAYEDTNASITRASLSVSSSSLTDWTTSSTTITVTNKSYSTTTPSTTFENLPLT